MLGFYTWFPEVHNRLSIQRGTGEERGTKSTDTGKNYLLTYLLHVAESFLSS